MGNLRPAPAGLTPQRIDSLFAALDGREQAYVIDTLERVGLPETEIARLFALAKRIDRKPLAVAGALISIALETVEAHG